MPLDVASQQLLAVLGEEPAPLLHEGTPAMARLSGPIFAGMSGRGPEVGAVDSLKLAGKDGGEFRMRTLKPEGEAQGIIVYFHGGGWVIGDIDLQYDTLGRQLCVATNCTVVMVNYRKAPEFPFPAAVDDSYIGLHWADAHRADLAAPGAPLIVAGDSAGGNLSAVMTQKSRDEDGPQIDYQVLVYPVTDCDLDRPSYVAPENQLLLARDTMKWFFDHYEPDESKRTDPAISPIRATSLEGLPPALVYLAECDPLHDEGAAYAQALRDAGVPVEESVAEGQMHAFFQMVNLLPGAAAGIAYVANRINARIADLAKESQA